MNPDAYQSYLLGRYYWNKRTADGLAQAGKYFQQAIQQDPIMLPLIPDCRIILPS